MIAFHPLFPKRNSGSRLHFAVHSLLLPLQGVDPPVHLKGENTTLGSACQVGKLHSDMTLPVCEREIK